MNNYDFHTLNDKDFEKIVRDLLNANFELGLQSFKQGRDKGIDLRYSSPQFQHDIVVQAKHYLHTSYSKFKKVLRDQELPKVEQLKPSRYIIATSLSLSAGQKDEITNIFKGYIHSANDVFGADDLNALLAKFPAIEQNHFKLWFSSVNVFNAIMNNAILGRTKHMLETVRNNIPFYVVTRRFDEAAALLKKNKILMITGQPGAGKTTLAETLAYTFAKNDYKILKIEDITEAEDVIMSNDKQLFYFDDFLGSNYYSIVGPGKTESQIASFINRVKNTPGKFMILTTRVVVLNTALEAYEKFNHIGTMQNGFEILLKDYSDYEKGLILYNHFYFRRIDKAYYNVLAKDNFYLTVVKHINYTPRIIDFITNTDKISEVKPSAYKAYILKNLNAPDEIWRYSFNTQIGHFDRCFLLTLFTFKVANEHVLMKAFQKRLEYEKLTNNQNLISDQFEKSVSILQNGFTTVQLIDSQPPQRRYVLLNPSLADFFISYVNRIYSEKKAILENIIYVEQLSALFSDSFYYPELELQTRILQKFRNNEFISVSEICTPSHELEDIGMRLKALVNYCPSMDIDDIAHSYLKRLPLDEESGWYTCSNNIEYVLFFLNKQPKCYHYIRENFFIIIGKLANCVYSPDNAYNLVTFFSEYRFDYEEFMKLPDGIACAKRMIEVLLFIELEEIAHSSADYESMDEVEALYENLRILEKTLRHELLLPSNIQINQTIELGTEYWEKIIADNLERIDLESEMMMEDERYHRNSDEERELNDFFK